VKGVPRKAVDMTAQFFESLLEGVARIVAERDKARMDELTERILAKLQEAATLPQIPAELPQERLLRPNEAAELLACSVDTVKKRMDAMRATSLTSWSEAATAGGFRTAGWWSISTSTSGIRDRWGRDGR